MAPPKCFFKRPEQFYSNGEVMIQPLKLKCHSQISSLAPVNKTEPNMCRNYDDLLTTKSQREFTTDKPLDLSFKNNVTGDTELLSQLGNFLFQHQLSTINLERLFSLLPQQVSPTATQLLYISPTPKSDMSWNPLTDNLRRHSPQSLTESLRDNSSSETSSQYATSQKMSRTSKRKLEGKVLRPFKLYKGTDSKGIMEALGITDDDEEWLKSIIEYKSVDDVFLFLTNCMKEATTPRDLSEDNIRKIRSKFGDILQNCNTSVSNPRMIRRPDMTPKELKTDEYWEKRRKNNDAAKRSRESRRNKEDDLNQHCEDIQMENDYLRKEIDGVKRKIDEIKRNIS